MRVFKLQNAFSGPANDADAQAFFTATGITDSTIKSAVTNMVTSLKANSLWTKIKAIYPYVGGTATTHKFNLKDPRDLDAAFRITWNGGVTHNSNGVTFNGTDGYGDSNLFETTVFGSSYISLHAYVRNSSNGMVIGGFVNNIFPQNTHRLNVNNITSVLSNRFPNLASVMSPDTYYPDEPCMYSSYRVDNSTAGVTLDGEPTTFSNSFTNNSATNIFLGKFFSGNYSNANVALHAITDNFTASQCDTFNTIVQTFQTALGRNNSKITFFFGDSITRGTGATVTANRWASLVSANKTWREVNCGATGNPLESATPVFSANLYDNSSSWIPTYRSNYKYLFISHVVNDTAYNTGFYTTSLFQTQYQSVINLCTSRGWPASKIILHCGFRVDTWINSIAGYGSITPADATRYAAFNAVVSSLASSNGCQFIDETGIYPGADMFDGVHPNDLGYQKIANNVISKV